MDDRSVGLEDAGLEDAGCERVGATKYRDRADRGLVTAVGYCIHQDVSRYARNETSTLAQLARMIPSFTRAATETVAKLR
jgi:hypothetical protein